MIHLLQYILQSLGLYSLSTVLPLGQQSTPLQVIEYDGFLSPEDFFNDHVFPGKPVVFRGAAKNFPAVQKWSDQYFLSFKESEEWVIAYEEGKKETREGGRDPITFSEYLRGYQKEDWYCVTGLPRFLRGDLPVYGSLQCDFILDHLMDDLVMWFSSGGTKSVWHCDDYENLNCLIAGKKQLVLASRTELELGHFEEGESYSKVDVDAVNTEQYPGFKNMTFYKATLEAGDCVYIPTFWSHVVRSWGRNIAINAWWEIYKTPFKCLDSKIKDWGSVSMMTDSDLGKAGQEVYKDPNNARKVSGNFRTILWNSQDMIKLEQLTLDGFIRQIKSYGELDADTSQVTLEKLFMLLDRNKDELLQPQEVDLIKNDEILFSLFEKAKDSETGSSSTNERNSDEL